MKILQVIPYYYPAWRFGGPVRVAYDISKKLAENGHYVVVYTSDIKDENTQVDACFKIVENVNVFYFKNLSTFMSRMKIYILPSLLLAAKRNLKSFDVVHIHGNRTSLNPLIYYFLKKHSIPYIVVAHGGIPRNKMPMQLWIYDLLFGFRFLKDASKVIALNHVEAEQYRSMGIRDEKIEIIPNGIDLAEYTDLPPKGSFKENYNIPLESKLILYLGRIHSSKGIDLIINSFSLVLERIKYGSTILVVIGPDDGYLDEVKSLAESVGVLDSVLFTGFVSAEVKRKALVDADIFVTPSFSGFPMTFLEACATGTPIITTTLGDCLEWIDSKAGFVTLPTSSDLSDAMYTLLTDDELREKFSENCRAIVRSEFSMEVIIEKWEKLYKNV